MSKRTLRARHSEQRVCAWLGRNGWTEILHNQICYGVQLDIVARSPQGVLTILEVKMQTPSGLAHVTSRQRARLLKASAVLAQSEPVQLRLVLLSHARLLLLPLDSV